MSCEVVETSSEGMSEVDRWLIKMADKFMLEHCSSHYLCMESDDVVRYISCESPRAPCVKPAFANIIRDHRVVADWPARHALGDGRYEGAAGGLVSS